MWSSVSRFHTGLGHGRLGDSSRARPVGVLGMPLSSRCQGPAAFQDRCVTRSVRRARLFGRNGAAEENAEKIEKTESSCRWKFDRGASQSSSA